MLWGDSWVDSKFTVGSIIPSETLQEISEIFLSAGVTFFDSAEGYGGGASERRLAESVDSLPGGATSFFVALLKAFSVEKLLTAINSSIY